MSDRWTDLLSDHLDGDLAPREAEALERHLEECDECRRTYEQLHDVRERARALVDPSAPDDLWAGIARQIGAAGPTSAPDPARIVPLPRRRRFDWSLPQLVAAGFAALLIGAAAVWMLRQQPTPVATRTGPETAPAATEQAALATFDAQQVEGEIAELRSALERGRGRLDPRTVEVLEKNLALIHQATQDAKAALAADPANAALQSYFASNVQRKLDLMRRANQLAGV